MPFGRSGRVTQNCFLERPRKCVDEDLLYPSNRDCVKVAAPDEPDFRNEHEERRMRILVVGCGLSYDDTCAIWEPLLPMLDEFWAFDPAAGSLCVRHCPCASPRDTCIPWLPGRLHLLLALTFNFCHFFLQNYLDCSHVRCPTSCLGNSHYNVSLFLFTGSCHLIETIVLTFCQFVAGFNIWSKVVDYCFQQDIEGNSSGT